MGEEQAADYLGDIIVDDKEEALAALVKWRRETGPANFREQDMKRVVRPCNRLGNGRITRPRPWLRRSN